MQGNQPMQQGQAKKISPTHLQSRKSADIMLFLQ